MKANKRLKWEWFILLVSFLFTSLCQTSKDSRQLIYVSIPPQKYFVEKIAGTNFQVRYLVTPGQSPATFEPNPQQIQELSTAKIYFRIGVSFEENWIDAIREAYPELLIVDTRDQIQLKPMDSVVNIFDTDSKHTDDNHHHGQMDPHIWLSPDLVKLQAQTIYQALVEIDPLRQQEYEQNYKQFIAEMDSLSHQIESMLSGLTNRKIMVYHPAWGYFARQFGLIQIPIEIEGKEPSLFYLQKIIEYAKQQQIKVIFVQKQFNAAIAEAIAQEIDGTVVMIDPLSEDYTDNLLSIARSIQKYLSK